MAESEYSTQLPKLQRYITTHDAEGKSIYVASPDQEYLPGPGRLSARSYAVQGLPVDLEGEPDIKAYFAGPESPASIKNHKGNIVLPGGTSCNVVELAPGASSPMHRTLSFDYAICTNGILHHELDSGEKVTLNPGDHIIQRGTAHKWVNASQTEPARFLAVSIPAVTFNIGGKMLREEWNLSAQHSTAQH